MSGSLKSFEGGEKMKANKLYFLVILLLTALVTSSCIRLPGWGPIDGACSEGHLFGEWEPRLSDPCAEGAAQKRTCSACYFSEKRVVPKGHQYVDRVCMICSAIDLSEGLRFSLRGKQSYVVLSIGTCTDAAIGIPSEYNGLPVRSIGDRSFEKCEFLRRVGIPDTVTSIGYRAFFGCSNLTSVIIPNSVTEIGSDAFRACTNLSYITIPAEMTRIGDSAFSNCKSLKTVYYGGTAAQWEEIAYDKWGNPSVPEHATVYCYSETDPGDGGNYWRYVDCVPTVWPWP